MTTGLTKIEETIHSVWLGDREPNQLAIEVEKYGHEVVVKRLKTGGFEGKTSIGEIKRGDDFFASIVDRRIINQAKKMHQTGKQRFLILAGNMSDERFRLKPVVGTILEMVFRYEIAIIPVMNVEVTIAYAIHCILTKVDGKRRPLVNYTQTRRYTSGLERNTNREMFRSIPGFLVVMSTPSGRRSVENSPSAKTLMNSVFNSSGLPITEIFNIYSFFVICLPTR